MRTILVFIFFTLCFNSFGQDMTFFIGDKTYSASKELKTGKANSNCVNALLNEITYFFVKDNKKGMMVFKNRYSRISGTIILYLDDNRTIKLLDTKKFDLVDNVYSSMYFLTEAEINILKTTNITTIRYSDGGDGAKTVANQDYECYDDFQSKKKIVKRHDIPEIISELFK